ncbi:MAG TPA: hypothetical protein VFO90_09370 [Terrimicrobiaceae bacterium]|nr:hypothetical protein [Terrimicrobiaceae bacterium]
MKVLRAVVGFLAIGSAAVASSPQSLGDFELADQNAVTRSYRFPKVKVTAMTVADRKGSQQLAPWIQRLYTRYAKRIDIDGIADVSGIPKPLRGMVSEVFRKNLTHSVMLDWGGSIVNRFGYERGVANIYLIDRRGRILKHVAGPVNDIAELELFQAIDRAITNSPPE